METFKAKKDRFSKARGGPTRFLQISCAKCGAFVAVYQKDGPGSLKRMYIDRIFSPEALVGLIGLPMKKLTPLSCAKCAHVIGVPFLYEEEDRPSFRLFEGAVSKKIIKIK